MRKGLVAGVGVVLVAATVAHAGFGQLVLTWTDNSTTETAFGIERAAKPCAAAVAADFAEIAQVATNVTTYTDTSVTVGTTYCYRVRALATGGLVSAYTNTAGGVPDGAPTNLLVK